MEEIGNILREAREARGITLAAVNERLKIQEKYLVAMEGGRFDELPTPVHARGYLKNYAKYLELDPLPLLDSFQSGFQNGGRRVRKNEEGVVPPRDGNPFFNPVNMQLNPSQNQNTGDSMLRIIIIVALLAAILLVASRFFVADGREFSLRQLYDTVVRGETQASVEEIDTAAILESAEVTPAESIIETSRNNLDEEILPTAVPVQALPTDLEIINATIETIERVFLIVSVDGEIVLQDNVASGETLDFTAQRQLDLSMGNAYAVVLSINGVEYGRMGQPRETRDITLLVNQ
jgi:cytoskeletal protein RodZ